jgi:signal transduction histidine kinase
VPGPALHEFISKNRDEILEICLEKVREYSPASTDSELAADFYVVIDEIVRALQEGAGLPVHSPLPGKSAAASKHGARRQRLGYTVEKIARDFGSISFAVGELSSRDGLSFGGREYQIFNSCVDTAIASALEQFSSESRRQYEDDTAQKIGFLAHELRNALSSARMSFVMLKGGQVGIHGKTADILERALRRLENLIGHTLLAVRLQAGKKPEVKRMRVVDLFTDVEETAVPERGIGVVVDADDALEVEVDEVLMISALSNLLQNAYKFTKPGGQITLRARPDEREPFVFLEVEDQCGGLPPGTHEDLFKPYVQQGKNRTGLGLGLAITREAVEAHNGELSVRDLPGEGCIFSIVLRGGRARRPG